MQSTIYYSLILFFFLNPALFLTLPSLHTHSLSAKKGVLEVFTSLTSDKIGRVVV